MTDEQTTPEQTSPLAVREVEESVATFDIGAADPIKALRKAEEVVTYMANKCRGPKYISNIQGRDYPKVDWWTTVGMGLGLFPVEIASDRVEDGEYITYHAIVEVRRGGQTITRASSLCSSRERTWRDRDEYAIKSMATTRATGKAYRIGLSGLAVMAGLEPTPAEEMPTTPDVVEGTSEHGVCVTHHQPYFMRGKMSQPAHKLPDGTWCNKPKPTAPKRKVSDAEQGFIELAKDRFENSISAVKWARDEIPVLAKRPTTEWTDDEWNRLADRLLTNIPDPEYTEV